MLGSWIQHLSLQECSVSTEDQAEKSPGERNSGRDEAEKKKLENFDHRDDDNKEGGSTSGARTRLEAGETSRGNSSSAPTKKPASSSSSCHFDRLKPRSSSAIDHPNSSSSNSSSSASMKRRSSDGNDTPSSSSLGASTSSDSKRAKKFQKEYSKLRSLVPSLTEREDSSKVEIIEETIRYIDALHHQLATRMETAPPGGEEQNQTGNALKLSRWVSDSDLALNCFFLGFEGSVVHKREREEARRH